MKRCFTLLAGVLSLALPLAALDQPSPAPSGQTVVTATKEPEDAQKLSSTVDVITSDDIERAGNLANALQTLAGIRLVSDSPSHYTLAARGYGDNAFGRTKLLLDGVSQNNPDMRGPSLNLVPSFAVDRIEVSYAPGTALWGDGASAGVVQVRTKVPSRFTVEAAAGVDQTLSNFRSLAAGMPVGRGGLLLSAQGTSNFPSRDRSVNGSLDLWGKFSQSITDVHSFDLWASYHRENSELPGGLTKAQYSSNPDQAGKPLDSESLEETRAGAQWTAEGTNLRLNVPASLSFRDLRAVMTSYPSFTDSRLLSLEAEPRGQIIVENLALGTLTLGTGAGYGYQRFVMGRYSSDSFDTMGTEYLLQRFNGKLWATAEENWNNQVVLSAAGRTEVLKTTADSAQSPSVQGERTFAPLGANLGAAYLPTAQSKLSLQISRSFRYPFLDEMISYYGFGGDKVLDLVPEISYGGDLGAENDFGFVKARATAFFQKVENEIVLNSVTYQNENSGTSYHAGAGAKLEVPLAKLWPQTGEAWTASVEYSFERAWYPDGSYAGNQVPLVPNHNLVLSTVWAPWKVLSLDADYQWHSSYYQGGDFANTADQVSWRQNLNLGADWILVQETKDAPQVKLRVFGKNLTNDRTPSYVYYGSWYPLPGRSLGLQAAVRY